MDTNWCTFCGKHIDSLEDTLYCSVNCRNRDSCGAAGHVGQDGSPNFMTMASPVPSPVCGSPKLWSKPSPTAPSSDSKEHSIQRKRSPSFTLPGSALGLSAKLPCRAPAYSTSPHTSLSSLLSYLPGSLSQQDTNGRTTTSSLPSDHRLSLI